MIRIFWFALICLIGLGVLAAMKMAGPLTTADVSQVEATISPMIVDHDALAKSDKLKVFHVEPVPEPTVVTPVATEPPKIAPKAVEATKIVSRHWHDPLAPKASSR
jgi:hypothetical protein